MASEKNGYTHMKKESDSLIYFSTWHMKTFVYMCAIFNKKPCYLVVNYLLYALLDEYFSRCTMVLILDGDSEHVANASSKICMFEKNILFVPALESNQRP